MWHLREWAAASNRRAIENARVAAVECSRRLVDRIEVDLYLAALAREAEAAATPRAGTRHPA